MWGGDVHTRKKAEAFRKQVGNFVLGTVIESVYIPVQDVERLD